MACYAGIDVGTQSARAGLFDDQGVMLSAADHSIQTWKPEADFAEQSTEDIWEACANALQSAVAKIDLDPDRVRGIGFDATCSLAVVDASGQPVTISPSGDDRRNVIVWMDHRASSEAYEINETGHEVLRYVGGKVSPEMQSPKLLWLKENLPDTWQRAAHFFDLADYLTYRATGRALRSLCTTVCKWTFVGHELETAPESAPDETAGWADDFWRAIGLEEFVEENYERIGQHVRPMGEPVGNGLSEDGAETLGLQVGTPVGVSMIDAHAGGIGILGASDDDEMLTPERMNRRLALIGGTSSCHMAVADEPRFIEGVWGPYYSAMIPGLWLNEGGQSATGALIDHVIFSHAQGEKLQEQADRSENTVYQLLNERLHELSADLAFPALLTRDLHVLPYFHGNRSPRADPSLRGAVTGLRLSDSLDELALLYYATIQSIAHGTRHIVDKMNQSGYEIDTIVATGGGTKNPVFVREHADVTGCQVILPKEQEAVLLGGAMLGTVAADTHASIIEAMTTMSQNGATVQPAGGSVASYHDAKHQVFHRLYHDQLQYREMMEGDYKETGTLTTLN